MDDIRDIMEYYDADPLREDTRLERHQLEVDLTWRTLEKYLPRQGRLMEVGAATGRYTRELARRGYIVTAVDLSRGLLEVNRARLEAAGLAGQVTLMQADARDLSTVSAGDFDAVLMMGPFYHLVREEDRRIALRQAAARLKPGGVVFSAFISRLGIMGDLMKKMPGWIEDRAEVQSILREGRDPDHEPSGGFRGYFATVEEIAPLHEALGFETLTLAGMEPAIGADDESYNCLEGDLRRLWLDLLEEISTEKNILAASRHLLYVGRKIA